MNKEYEDLLGYVASFERAQQQEAIKLEEEKTKHHHTKQMVKNALANIESSKQAIEAMQNTMKEMRKRQLDEEKAGKQLKESMSSLKKESRLLEEHLQKITNQTCRKREYYEKTKETAKERLSQLRGAYSGSMGSWQFEAPSDQAEASTVEHEEKELHAKVELLRSQIQLALEEKELFKKSLEVAPESEKRRQCDDGPHQEHEEMVTKMESELLMQRDIVQRQVELLSQQKTLQEAALKELHDLDKYGRTLNQTYEELQQYCSELETVTVALSCQCEGNKRADKEVVEQSEDPIVHD